MSVSSRLKDFNLDNRLKESILEAEHLESLAV